MSILFPLQISPYSVRVIVSDSTEYIALLPLDEDGGNEDGDVWIYRFIRDTTGGSDHDLQNIEDDDEYDRAADKFDEWLDTQEFEGFDIEE